MSELWPVAFALGVGIVLGAVFFGGLWWTVVRAISSRRVALWFLCSLVLRTSVVVGGFYLVARSDPTDAAWAKLLVCLFGFLCARLIVTRLTAAPAAEVSHAS